MSRFDCGGDEPDWRDVFEVAKQNRLGVDDDAPVAKGSAVAELRSRGFAPRFVDRAVESGVIEVADENGFVPKYELAEGEDLDIAESGLSEKETKDTDRTKPADGRVLEAFEMAIDFMHDRLEDSLPEDCDVDAETPREYFEDGRDWDNDTVEQKRLAYAPVSLTALLDALMREGFTRDEILATGLFYEGLKPHFQGRVVLPYFDDDGQPVYAISRSIGHLDDPKSEQKYTKAVKTEEYSSVDEPIYGLETLDEDAETVLVAEGIADAITVHEKGYAAISPVTTQFKKEHHDVLLDVVEDTEAHVVIVADNDAVSSDLNDDGKLEVQQHGEGLKGALYRRLPRRQRG